MQQRYSSSYGGLDNQENAVGHGAKQFGGHQQQGRRCVLVARASEEQTVTNAGGEGCMDSTLRVLFESIQVVKRYILTLLLMSIICGESLKKV